MPEKNLNNNTDYVWYACYGSNILKSRFMMYIEDCRDQTPPVEDRPYEFDHDIYFAKFSLIWDHGGKAFLDIHSDGHAYGRIYKVTREQFLKIKSQEGYDYTRELQLGLIDGIPVYSFTDVEGRGMLRMPSCRYYRVILDGLKECYSGLLEIQEIVSYLNEAVMSDQAFSVAKAIRNNAVYLTHKEIQERTGLDKDTATENLRWLLDHEVIVQDTRSIRRGHQVSDEEAFFYTKDSMSGRELVNAMIQAEEAADEESELDADVNDSGIESLTAGREGHRSFVYASRIERNQRNRINAIKAHGYKCQVCGFDYEQVYGELGRHYIEVHHINPLSEQDGEQEVDPVTDMVCLCANCHRMIHRNRNHVLSIEELKQLMDENR